jgi:hypothetical protein
MSTPAIPKYQSDEQELRLHYFQQDRAMCHMSNNWVVEEVKSFFGDMIISKGF